MKFFQFILFELVTFVVNHLTMKVNLKSLHIFFFILVFGTSCIAQNTTNESEEIKSLLAKKRAYNKKYGFGYRIQLYNGSEQKARRIRARFRIEFPNNSTKLVYKAPEWKVQVGNYKTKLDADKDLLVFREKFSGIIVVPMGK